MAVNIPNEEPANTYSININCDYSIRFFLVMIGTITFALSPLGITLSLIYPEESSSIFFGVSSVSYMILTMFFLIDSFIGVNISSLYYRINEASDKPVDVAMKNTVIYALPYSVLVGLASLIFNLNTIINVSGTAIFDLILLASILSFWYYDFNYDMIITDQENVPNEDQNNYKRVLFKQKINRVFYFMMCCMILVYIFVGSTIRYLRT